MAAVPPRPGTRGATAATLQQVGATLSMGSGGVGPRPRDLCALAVGLQPQILMLYKTSKPSVATRAETSRKRAPRACAHAPLHCAHTHAALVRSRAVQAHRQLGGSDWATPTTRRAQHHSRSRAVGRPRHILLQCVQSGACPWGSCLFVQCCGWTRSAPELRSCARTTRT